MKKILIFSSISLALATQLTFASPNYPEISCDADYFKSNSCNQCFDGGSKRVGERLVDLADGWTNPNSFSQVIYKGEQKSPELVNLGQDGTKWTQTPTNNPEFWNFSDDIIWVNSEKKKGDQEVVLEGSGTIGFLKSLPGSYYSLDESNKNNGDPVGLLKFTLNYHDLTDQTKESEMKPHTECVVYTLSKAAEVIPQKQMEAPTPAPQPKPQDLTKPKTGTEEIFLLLAAFIAGFFILIFRRKVD